MPRVRPERALHRGVLRNEESGGRVALREKCEVQRAKFKVMPRVRPERALHRGVLRYEKGGGDELVRVKLFYSHTTRAVRSWPSVSRSSSR